MAVNQVVGMALAAFARFRFSTMAHSYHTSCTLAAPRNRAGPGPLRTALLWAQAMVNRKKLVDPDLAVISYVLLAVMTRCVSGTELSETGDLGRSGEM